MESDRGPAFRIWPPVSVGGPLVAGLLASTTVIDHGPFAWSRNPLYVGLLVGSAGVALLAGSLWALVVLPMEWALLLWGAVVPEEQYLAAKFGPAYSAYTSRVRRWL